jgi:CHAD domain-containing protein
MLTSTYLDTDDLRLAKGGITLRRREQADAPSAWQLEVPRDGHRPKLEWEAPDVRVPDEIARLLTAHTRGRPLRAVAKAQVLGFEPPPPPVTSPDRSQATLQALLRAQYDEILLHDPGTRMGREPDELHDHRVAVRRLRALLRAGRPLLDRVWADDLRDALRQAGRALADVRDLDVMLADVARLARGLPEPERSGASDIVERLQQRRDAAQARLADEISEPWYISVLNRTEQAVDAPRFDGTGSLAKVVHREHRRTRKLVRALPADPADTSLHAVRKAVKRGRYAAELADAAGIAGMAKYVKRAKAVQDVLGDHQDAVVAMAMLAEVDGSLRRPAAHLAVRALADGYEARRVAARKSFPNAWRRLDKRAP